MLPTITSHDKFSNFYTRMNPSFNPDDILANAHTSVELELGEIEEFAEQQKGWEAINDLTEFEEILGATEDRMDMLKAAILKAEKEIKNSAPLRELTKKADRIALKTLREKHRYLLAEYGETSQLLTKQMDHWWNLRDEINPHEKEA